MQHRRRRDAELGGLARRRAQELEILSRRSLRALQLADDLESRRRELHRSRLLAKLHRQPASDGDALEAFQEIGVEHRAAVLTVGHGLEAELFLERDRLTDALVFDGAKLVVGELAVGVTLPSFAKLAGS